MSEVDLGQVKMTDAELMDFILQFNGGVRLGKDAEGKAGYITTDEETGADTVVPFSNGVGGSIQEIDVLYFGRNSSTSTSTSVTAANNIAVTVEKKYKNILCLVFYNRAASNYNYPISLAFTKTSTGTYEINEKWSYDNFSTTNLFSFMYAALWDEINTGETIGYSISLNLGTQTNSGTKILITCILGID